MPFHFCIITEFREVFDRGANIPRTLARIVGGPVVPGLVAHSDNSFNEPALNSQSSHNRAQASLTILVAWVAGAVGV